MANQEILHKSLGVVAMTILQASSLNTSGSRLNLFGTFGKRNDPAKKELGSQFD